MKIDEVKKMAQKFLVVDDANFMRLLLKKIIVESGHEVVGEAENGRVAIELTKQLAPDVIIMDITMPEVNGLDALREIMEFNPKIKVIMCSAIDRKDMILKALQMGARDFISKPFDESKVKKVIKKVISSGE